MANVVNSWWMYLIGALVCVFVLATSVFFIIKAYKDAKAINMDTSKLKKTLVTSAVFSLLPSVSILIGVIALSGTIGIPLPWIRLSVIGALHYEQTAVKTAYDNLTLATMTNQQFVTVAFVMTLGIIAGPLYCLFGFKAYDKKLLSKTRKAPESVATDSSANGNEIASEAQQEAATTESTGKKKAFGPILFSAAFIALISSFLAEEICKIKFIGKIDEINPKTGEIYGKLGTYTPIIVVAVSFLVMWLMSFLAKKTKWRWLDDFAMGISMLAGMGAAILVEVL